MTRRATGERMKQSVLRKNELITNARTHNIVNIDAEDFFITPVGISLLAVLGFSLSYSASSIRLNAMEALRPKTIHDTTISSFWRLNGYPSCHTARKKPIMANGIANIV